MENAFLQKLSHDWWRYHQLLTEFLQQELQRTPDLYRSVNRRAGQWYLERNEILSAISHLIEAQAFQEISALLEKEGNNLVKLGFTQTLSGWFDRIPEEWKGNSLQLLILRGLTCEHQGNWAQAIANYRKALTLQDAAQDGAAASIVHERIAICSSRYDNPATYIEACEKALEICPASDRDRLSHLYQRLGAGILESGLDWARGYNLIKEGYLLARQTGNPDTIISACALYAYPYQFSLGNFDEALKVLNEGITLCRNLDIKHSLLHLYMNKALTLIFSCRFGEAIELARSCLRTGGELGSSFLLQSFSLLMGEACLLSGDHETAITWFDQAGRNEIPAQLMYWYYSHRALCELKRGTLSQAKLCCEKATDSLRLRGHGFITPEIYISTGLVELARGNRSEALEFFQKALDFAEKASQSYFRMKAHYYLAFMNIESDVEEALRHLEMTMTLSIRNDHCGFWSTDLFDMTIPLAFLAYRYDIERDYILKIIDRLPQKALDYLLTIVDSEDTEKANLACELLSRFNDERAIEALRRVKHSEDEALQKRAKELLAFRERIRSCELRITTLGHFSILRDGLPVGAAQKKRKKNLLLFKYFLTNLDKEVTYDQLIELFWAHKDIEQARNNLQVSISHLRQLLNPAAGTRASARDSSSHLVSIKNGYILHLGDEHTVDFRDFRQCCLKGFEAEQMGDEEAYLEYYRRALELYGGPYLPDDIYEDWTYLVREELDSLFTQIHLRLARHYFGRRSYAEGRTHYLTVLQDHPYEEGVYLEYITNLHNHGRKTTALQEYHKLGRRFEKMGLSISVQTRSTLDALFQFEDTLESRSFSTSDLESADGALFS
jgi:DNA-binding SARP family transcriptional activator